VAGPRVEPANGFPSTADMAIQSLSKARQSVLYYSLKEKSYSYTHGNKET